MQTRNSMTWYSLSKKACRPAYLEIPLRPGDRRPTLLSWPKQAVCFQPLTVLAEHLNQWQPSVYPAFHAMSITPSEVFRGFTSWEPFTCRVKFLLFLSNFRSSAWSQGWHGSVMTYCAFWWGNEHACILHGLATCESLWMHLGCVI